LLYFGAMNAGNATATVVTSDIRLAVSNDGTQFQDMGTVVSHADRSVWGFGDELFPVGAFRSGATYYIYYIAKGNGVLWNLGLAWGMDRNLLPDSQEVIASGDYIVGGGDAVWVDGNVLALFLFRVSAPGWKNPHMEVRLADMASPTRLSAPVERYDGAGHSLVYFENDRHRWLMYYHSNGEIRVRSAGARSMRIQLQPPTIDGSR
jgi:hypothetical protein